MWAKIIETGPLVMRVLKEIFEGVSRGASNEEIRQRIASKDVLLDEELDKLRDAKDDLRSFIETGS